MFRFVTWALLTSAVVGAAEYLLPGIHPESFATAFGMAFFLGACNAILAPAAYVITLPINILSAGFLSFILISLLISGISLIFPGVAIESTGALLSLSLLLSFLNLGFFGVL